MMKSGIDQDALIKLFSETTARQGAALRKAVSEATLKALQGRELTVENIRKVVKTVAQASAAGAALNPSPSVDAEALLTQAVSGIDAALLQAVQAQQKALEMVVAQGVGVDGKQMKAALAHVENMEDLFFGALGRAAKGADAALQGPWQQVIDSMKLKGSATGAGASGAVEQLLAQAQNTLRESRAGGLRAAQAMLDSYAAMASGVLIGMSEALTRGQTSAAPSPAASAPRKAARARRA